MGLWDFISYYLSRYFRSPTWWDQVADEGIGPTQ